MDYTATGLIADIRRRASIPTTPSPGNRDSDLLAHANDLLRLELLAEIIPLQEGYFLRNTDTQLPVTALRVPPRAVAGRLRALQLLDASGRELGDPLAEISVERSGLFAADSGLFGYRFEGSNIVLVGSSSTSAAQIRMKWYQRPNELVTSGYTTITDIDAGNNRVEVASTSGFTTSTLIDLVAATPGFESHAIDLLPSNVGTPANTITFSEELPDNLAVGDYVCLAEESPVPQLPETYWSILSQAAACEYLAAKGLDSLLKTAVARLESMKKGAGMLSSPRNDSAGGKIVNRFSFLGWPAGGFRRGWY